MSHVQNPEPSLYVNSPDLRGPKGVVVFYAYGEPRTSVLQTWYHFVVRSSTVRNRSGHARSISDNRSYSRVQLSGNGMEDTESSETTVTLKVLTKKTTKNSMTLITNNISIAVDSLCPDFQVVGALSYRKSSIRLILESFIQRKTSSTYTVVSKGHTTVLETLAKVDIS